MARVEGHPVFAEQVSQFVPLAADAMRQANRVVFLGSEATALVPGASNAVTYDADLHGRNQLKHGSWVLQFVPKADTPAKT